MKYSGGKLNSKKERGLCLEDDVAVTQEPPLPTLNIFIIGHAPAGKYDRVEIRIRNGSKSKAPPTLR